MILQLCKCSVYFA